MLGGRTCCSAADLGGAEDEVRYSAAGAPPRGASDGGGHEGGAGG